MKYLIVLISFLSINSYCNSLTVGFAGLTYHAANYEESWEPYMKRKLSKDGRLVWNPELNISFNKEDTVYNLTWLNDCFGRDAYFIGAGKRWVQENNITFGLIGGLYIRPTFKIGKETLNTPDEFVHGKTEIIPLPWLYIQKDFEITENVSFTTQASSNYMLTHIIFGITVNNF